MDGKEFAASLINAIELRQQRGELVVTLALLKSLVREALNPELAMTFERPPVPPQLPVEAEYPRLKVKYDRATGRPLEYRIVSDVQDEIGTMAVPWNRRPMSEVEDVRRMIECAD